jgi:uncharacterized protein YidB (DUF937 family)
MGFLGNLMAAAENTATASPADASAGVHQGLLDHVLGVVGNPATGGLGGLVEKLKAGGLGPQVSSWIGSGPNQAVSADQIQAALGNEHVQELAQKFGLSPSEVSSHLSQILPEVISHLSPGGSLPDHGAVQSAIGLLRGKLFG